MKRCFRPKVGGVLLLYLILFSVSAYSQKRDDAHDALPKAIENASDDLFKKTLDTLSLKERVAIRTNTLEWAMMTPNVMVEFDILPYNWNKWTVAIGGRYNDFGKDILSPRNILRMKTFRVETRRYWHTTYRYSPSEGRRAWSSDWSAIRKALSRQRRSPREERRAYYVGGFASMSEFAIKLGRTGKQGKATMFGLSFGWQQPLYGYSSGSTIDLELGVSAGAAKVDYDTFTYNSQYNCYPVEGERTQKVVPALSEVRVALVYRFGRSSRERFNDRYSIDYAYNELVNQRATERYKKNVDKVAKRDSIKQAKEEEARMKMLEKQHADSVAILKSRSAFLYAYEEYKKLGEEVKMDSTEYGRMLRERIREHMLLKKAEAVSPERYQAVKDSLNAAKMQGGKSAGKAAGEAGKAKKAEKKKAAKGQADAESANSQSDGDAASQNQPAADEEKKAKKARDKKKKDKKEAPEQTDDAAELSSEEEKGGEG